MATTKKLFAVAALFLFQHTGATNFKLPPCLEPFRPFVYSGCFQDGSPRTLEYRSGQSSRNMTIEACVAECKGNGFRYAGLEYYGECYCGATVNSPVLDESQCTFPCNGNKSEICGGNDALSIYQDPTFTTHPNEVDIEDYAPLGCYTDDGPNGRSLPWPRDIPQETFTPAKCLAACRDRGFPFAGTEFAQECYCGSVMGNYTTEAPAQDCNMPCRGDPSQICGGRKRLTLYVARELLSLEPCGHQPPVNTTSSTSVTTPTSTSKSSESPPPTPTSTSKSSLSSETSTSTSKSSESPPPTPTSTSKSSVSSSETSTSTSKSSESPPPTPTSTSKSSVSFSKTSTSTSKSSLSSSSTPTSKSSTSPPPTPTSTSKSSVSSSKTSKPYDTTTRPSTTTKFTSTTTKTSSLCTTTITPPSECEYKVGNWCAPPLPDFDHVDGCLDAWKSCAKLVTSCWKYAGFPASLECLDFSDWCAGIKHYCSNDCKYKTCNKNSCYDKHKPHYPKPTKPPVTSVYPCPTTTTTLRTSTKSTVTSVIPEPTNICKQPTSKKDNYGPGNPVGGIELPLVTCNDIKEDFGSRPFKLYTEPDTRRCKSYSRYYCSDACKDACKEQYEQCKETYVESCKPSWGGWSYDYDKSPTNCYGRCTSQYHDCLLENIYVDPGNRCKIWGAGLKRSI